MLNIYISTSSFATFDSTPIDLLKKQNFSLAFNKTGKKINTIEYVDRLASVNAIIAGTESYSREILNKFSNLQVISRLGVGVDNIDLERAKQLGIKVFRTKTTPALAVSELALGMMLDLSRSISIQDGNLKSGHWKKYMGNLLHGKTLGIIGLGTIGKTLVQLVNGFNLNILAFDLYRDENYEKKYSVKFCDLDTLLTQSDIVSIHLNLSAKTNQLLNKDNINKLKPECILINTSRGEIIDEAALVSSLKENKILGAGLDVYNQEPYNGPLTELENVVLTPHIGSYAKEVRIQMEIEATKNLIKGLNGN